jgi:DNA-binding SARP family transcriptional activator
VAAVESGGQIYIKTFGKFDIAVGGRTALSGVLGQHSFLKLLAFFLVNRGRAFGNDAIVEKVWPDKEYHDNGAIMRTQVFRLKKQLAETVPGLHYSLDYAHGGYVFSIEGGGVVFDTDAFRELYGGIFPAVQGWRPDGGGPGDGEPGADGSAAERSMALCREAIRLYDSGFLPEPAFDGGWAIPLRLNYRRQWFRIAELYVELCGQHGKYDEIIALCQRVLQYEGIEEFFHEAYMDALCKAGCAADAARHYEQCTAGAGGEALSGSMALKALYRGALREISHSRSVNASDIRDLLDGFEQNSQGAVVCDKDSFFGYCHAMRHIALRMSFYAYVCILELPDAGRDPARQAGKSGAAGLVGAMKATFRSGDILCEWSDRQVLMLYVSGKALDEGALHRQVERAIAQSDMAPLAPGGDGDPGGVAHYPLFIQALPLVGDEDIRVFMGERRAVKNG